MEMLEYMTKVHFFIVVTISPPQSAIHTREMKFGCIVTEFVYIVNCLMGIL